MNRGIILVALGLMTGCSSGPSEKINVISGSIENPIVIPPKNCPDFSKWSAADWSNTVNSNYGCATTTNLGVMVANPNDMIAGQASDLYNAARTSVSVGSYEAGPSSSGASGGSSGGGGGGGGASQ